MTTPRFPRGVEAPVMPSEAHCEVLVSPELRQFVTEAECTCSPSLPGKSQQRRQRQGGYFRRAVCFHFLLPIQTIAVNSEREADQSSN
ncbi:hypothetical protein HBH56_088990 [Parastagonospora nodorum]|uniref:Uncharacterized protein n=1 Tax=Phaeosphaeria nodorum (strain SN15 / ATCC MYA-4574 / FGSC 10173) TaxID=321614 RepID=A0A7U2HZW8_PHANO|nr:hypothetical protein HBH56_088990 [Parastagonospora nodorum]QRC98100.1 hypothetical protein JI435_411460 [Parastagonospora nodorum SN15]KAH3936179.1 hypothetical protein HBH54_023630 [Parastagonospora nodorum]KAH3966259.1 hypothetical protein HBH51_144640 [Parastagonospora nodorum]KAH3998076.1 hypothetical protein HBI10_132500 [Parastagonospora nodorum]